ncbi:hypothetical protein CBS147337_10411 [Penicillium roqueforti]|nr:hypothetical protein CBS147337_10411 [Penicillium roqueforti]
MASSYASLNFDGQMRVDANHAGNPQYAPNSFGNKFRPDTAEAPYQLADNTVSRKSFLARGSPSEYEQSRALYEKVMNGEARDHLHFNTASALKKVDYPMIQYKFYEIHFGKTVFSRDAEFDERTSVAPLTEGKTDNNLPDNAPPSPVFPSMPSSASGLPTPPASPLAPSNEREKTPSEREKETPPVVNPNQQGTDLTSDLGYSIYGRRRRPSRRLLESVGKMFTAGALNTAPARQVDPATFHEAVSGPDQLEWWAAIQQEYASLLEHGTWEKVRREDVPAGDHVIGCKWVFKTKANGTRKARLVIKGYRQKHGIDYHETQHRVRGWKLHQFDAVTAFLHGDVDSSIYMELPEGFEEPGPRGVGTNASTASWPLMASPWPNQTTVCSTNRIASFVFMSMTSLVAAANTHEIEQVQRALQTELRLNDLGTPRSFLGIQFDYHLDGSVSIHQHQYIQKVLSDFGMETCQPKSTPMNPKQTLNHRPEEERSDEEAKARYATAIGSLMYLMIGTRPDVAFALGMLSRFTSQPQSHHQVALQRLLRYIKATQTYRITYRSGQLIGYTDADFGGFVVTDGAYSTSGYVFQLAGAPVSWSSKRQGKWPRLQLMPNTSDNTMPSCISNGFAPFWARRSYIGLRSPTSW